MSEIFMTIDGCDKKHRETMSVLNEIKDRLYKDNGHLSIQTRLDRGDRILGVLCWVTTVGVGTIIVSVVALVWKTILHIGA